MENATNNATTAYQHTLDKLTEIKQIANKPSLEKNDLANITQAFLEADSGFKIFGIKDNLACTSINGCLIVINNMILQGNIPSNDFFTALTGLITTLRNNANNVIPA